MSLPLKQSALALIASTMAAIIEPLPPVAPSAWAGENFVLPDGEHKNELIDLKRTPHLVEPLDALGDAAPDNEIDVMKSAQAGFTTLLEILAGYTVDRAPCDMMIVQPTDGALSDFNSQKLGRAIDASRERGEATGVRTWGVKIAPQASRSATASTTYEKKFGNSSIVLALATSSADLRSKTIKIALCDEIDEYPDNLNNQGDPLEQVAARQITFLRSGTWKRAKISTPRIEGASKIQKRYLSGDQRRWFVQCPHCSDRFVFDVIEFKKFAPYDGRTPGLKFNKQFPYDSHYVTPCCGGIIKAAQKYAVYATGEWRATAPAPGKSKSYHFAAAASPFVPWDVIAKLFVDAGEDEQKLKTFCNLWLGLPFEPKGDAPDWQALLDRKGGYDEGIVPPRGLLFVAGADVQHSGIWVEAVAYAPDQQSWSVRHEFLEGDTTDPASGAFVKLAEFFDKRWPDAFGGERTLDGIAVDAGDGGRFNQVVAWCRSRPKAYAIKGVPGWAAPAMGTPITVDINLKGQKVKGAGTLWPVGTWSLKSIWFSNLIKPRGASAEPFPKGYVHFHDGVDERYMRQVTSEYLTTGTYRGRTVQVWKETGPNHLLDARVYAMACAEYLGLTRMSAGEWQELARRRAPSIQPDLFAPEPLQVVAAVATEASAPNASDPPPEAWSNRLGNSGDWWGQR